MFIVTETFKCVLEFLKLSKGLVIVNDMVLSHYVNVNEIRSLDSCFIFPVNYFLFFKKLAKQVGSLEFKPQNC
jgi:hypothetical protein